MKIDNPVQYLRETADILWTHGTRAGHRSKMLLSVASHFDIVVDEWQFGARSAADTQRLLSCVGLATALRRDVREEEEEEEAAKTNVPTGWRPPVRVITAVDELSALPEMAIIRDKEGRVLELAERDAAGRMYWWEVGVSGDESDGAAEPNVVFPAAVVWEPGPAGQSRA